MKWGKTKSHVKTTEYFLLHINHSVKSLFQILFDSKLILLQNKEDHEESLITRDVVIEMNAIFTFLEELLRDKLLNNLEYILGLE